MTNKNSGPIAVIINQKKFCLLPDNKFHNFQSKPEETIYMRWNIRRLVLVERRT